MKRSLRFWGYLNVILGLVNVLFVMLNIALIITGVDTSVTRQILVGLNASSAVVSLGAGLWILRRAR